MSQYKHPKIAEISYFPTQHPGAARWFLGPPLAACHRLPWRPTTSPACDSDDMRHENEVIGDPCSDMYTYRHCISTTYIHINLYKITYTYYIPNT